MKIQVSSQKMSPSLLLLRDNTSQEDVTKILKLQVKNVFFLPKPVHIRADTRKEKSLACPLRPRDPANSGNNQATTVP